MSPHITNVIKGFIMFGVRSQESLPKKLPIFVAKMRF
jgi:hypothetical protein